MLHHGSRVSLRSPEMTAELAEAQDYKLGVIVNAPLQLLIAFRRSERAHLFFDHHQCFTCEPPTFTRRNKRSLGEPLSIWRIEKDERKRLDRMGSSELRGITAEDFRC